MTIGTLHQNPPPFFRQGQTALSRLVLFSSLAIFLMVADARFQIAQPIRMVMATLGYPIQWLSAVSVHTLQGVGRYFADLDEAQNTAAQARQTLLSQAQKASQMQQLAFENAHLRQLLHLRDRLTPSGAAAEVLYAAADPYTRKIIIDTGLLGGLEAGSPVIDERGVLGQVTRVYPMVSEVTLVVDHDHATPVLNSRTGARSVAYGDPYPGNGGLELRFIAGNADVQKGDELTTSGIDGVYPTGIPVARVERVERRADSAFARIYCVPLARIDSARHVMVLKPLSTLLPPRPQDNEAAAPQTAIPVPTPAPASGPTSTAIKPTPGTGKP